MVVGWGGWGRDGAARGSVWDDGGKGVDAWVAGDFDFGVAGVERFWCLRVCDGFELDSVHGEDLNWNLARVLKWERLGNLDVHL